MISKSVAISILACGLSFCAGYLTKNAQIDTNIMHVEKAVEFVLPQTKSDINSALSSSASNNFSEPTPEVLHKQFITSDLDDFLSLYQNANYLTIPNRALLPLYAKLAQLDEYQLQQTAAELIEQLPGAAVAKLLGVTLEVLAEQQPLQALEMALNISNKEQFKWSYAWSVLSVWSTDAPLDAYQWYVEQDFSQAHFKEFGTQHMVATAVLSGLYSYDKSLGVAKIAELAQQGKLNPSSLSLISNSINHSEEFATLLNTLSNSEHNVGVVEVTGEWFSKQPNDAAAWLNMLSEEQKSPRMLRQALNRWSESEPSQAASWYIEQFSGEKQLVAISEAASRFASEDPKQAIEWVDSLGRNDTDNAIEDLLQRASYDNPDFVMSNLDRVSDEKRKLSLLQSSIYTIHQQDVARATKLIDASPYKAELEAYIKKVNSY